MITKPTDELHIHGSVIATAKGCSISHRLTFARGRAALFSVACQSLPVEVFGHIMDGGDHQIGPADQSPPLSLHEIKHGRQLREDSPMRVIAGPYVTVETVWRHLS